MYENSPLWEALRVGLWLSLDIPDCPAFRLACKHARDTVTAMMQQLQSTAVIRTPALLPAAGAPGHSTDAAAPESISQASAMAAFHASLSQLSALSLKYRARGIEQVQSTQSFLQAYVSALPANTAAAIHECAFTVIKGSEVQPEALTTLTQALPALRVLTIHIPPLLSFGQFLAVIHQYTCPALQELQLLRPNSNIARISDAPVANHQPTYNTLFISRSQRELFSIEHLPLLQVFRAPWDAKLHYRVPNLYPALQVLGVSALTTRGEGNLQHVRMICAPGPLPSETTALLVPAGSSTPSYPYFATRKPAKPKQGQGQGQAQQQGQGQQLQGQAQQQGQGKDTDKGKAKKKSKRRATAQEGVSTPPVPGIGPGLRPFQGSDADALMHLDWPALAAFNRVELANGVVFTGFRTAALTAAALHRLTRLSTLFASSAHCWAVQLLMAPCPKPLPRPLLLPNSVPDLRCLWLKREQVEATAENARKDLTWMETRRWRDRMNGSGLTLAGYVWTSSSGGDHGLKDGVGPWGPWTTAVINFFISAAPKVNVIFWEVAHGSDTELFAALKSLRVVPNLEVLWLKDGDAESFPGFEMTQQCGKATLHPPQLLVQMVVMLTCHANVKDPGCRLLRHLCVQGVEAGHVSEANAVLRAQGSVVQVSTW